jgi:hypothetical protein
MMATPDSAFKYAGLIARAYSAEDVAEVAGAPAAVTAHGGIPDFVAAPRAARPGAIVRKLENPA